MPVFLPQLPLTANPNSTTDLPVWEWLTFFPSTVPSNMTSDNERFLYFATSTLIWRYDTWTNSWQQLSSAASIGTIKYSNIDGFQGRVLSSTSTTFTGAGLYGQILNGYRVKIIAGTGLGQEKTITNVADPVMADSGIATAVSNSNNSTFVAGSITDSVKTWSINQYAGYQVRITYGTGVGQSFKILYNNATQLFYAALGFRNSIKDNYPVIKTNLTATNSMYSIESSVFTIDSSWTINPDYTSVFLILNGKIRVNTVGVTASNIAPVIANYDVLEGNYYQPTSTNTIVPDSSSHETITDLGGNFLTGTATSGGSNTLTDTTLDLTANRYKNYQLKITAGTGMGQYRGIISHTNNQFTIAPVWNIQPNNTSQYSIVADTDKNYFIGTNNTRGGSQLCVFSQDAQMMITGQMYDWGMIRSGSVALFGNEGLPLGSITNSGTTATATLSSGFTTDSGGHYFRTGDSVTITGATGVDASLYNGIFTITVTSSSVFTYTMSGTPTGSAIFDAQSTTQLVDSTKNWTTNEHAGRLVNYTGAIRKIITNTATTLTFSTSSAPSNGQGTYVIYDIISFGSHDNGTATSGTTTTLTDSTKNWVVNQWAGKRVTFTSGIASRQESTISSNTATVLTFTAVTTAPDSNTTYSILQIAPRTTLPCLLIHAYGTSDGKYIYAPRASGTNIWNRYDITTQSFDALSISPQFETLSSTASMFAYDGEDRIYFTKDATGRVYYYDIILNTINFVGKTPYTITSNTCNKMEVMGSIDGLKYLYFQNQGSTEFWRLPLYY